MNITSGLRDVCMFPIGYIWLSLSDVNPSNLVGGVWKKIEDVFLLGSGKHALNSRGGGRRSYPFT